MAQRGGEHRRERVSLVLASGLHLIAFAVAWRAQGTGAPRASSPEVTELAIDLAEPLPTGPALEPEPVAPPPPSPTVATHQELARVAPPASPSRPSGDDVAPLGPSPTSPRVREPAPAQPAPPPALSLTQLGLAGPNRFIEAPDGASSWSIADAHDGVQRSIAESLLKHDRAVGLGSEGPAIGVIEEVVVASTAAVNGRAVLDLTADATGAIIHVACTDGDRAQWDRIAADVAHALDGKRLRAAPGGRGVSMRIEVTSREQLPSGRDPGLELRAFNLPLKKGRGPRSTRIDLLEVAPRVVVDDPEGEGEGPQAQATPVKFPKAHIELVKVFGLNGDPADIAANARRVVHARVLEEHPL